MFKQLNSDECQYVSGGDGLRSRVSDVLILAGTLSNPCGFLFAEFLNFSYCLLGKVDNDEKKNRWSECMDELLDGKVSIGIAAVFIGIKIHRLLNKKK